MATTKTTKALVLPNVGASFELREISLAGIQEDEVLVEIHATGLCHTDLAFADGTLPCQPNAVLGHEGAGVVVDVGSGVSSVRPGDRVLLSFSHCESCAQCRSGHPAYCYTFNERNFRGARPDGSRAMFSCPPSAPATQRGDSDAAADAAAAADQSLFSSFFGQSSFARHTLAHRSCVVKVPAETDLALFAPLGCGIQTGAGAVLNTLDVNAQSTLAVFGAGSVGMAAIMAGHMRAAKTIIAVDLHADRLELATRLGATHTVQARADVDVVQQIRELCPPNGVDFAIDCTGSARVVETMIRSLGTRGCAATVGAPGFGVTVPVNVMDQLTFGKKYVGCCEGDSLPSEVSIFLSVSHP